MPELKFSQALTARTLSRIADLIERTLASAPQRAEEFADGLHLAGTTHVLSAFTAGAYRQTLRTVVDELRILIIDHDHSPFESPPTPTPSSTPSPTPTPTPSPSPTPAPTPTPSPSPTPTPTPTP